LQKLHSPLKLDPIKEKPIIVRGKAAYRQQQQKRDFTCGSSKVTNDQANALRMCAPEISVEHREPVPALPERGRPMPPTGTLRMHAPEDISVEQRE